MLIGIISDSHDHISHVQKAVAVFKRQKVELVLHAGDYCSPFIIPLFEALPLKGVFGNNDGDHYLLMRKFKEIGGELLGTFGDLEFDDLRIALYHGTNAPITKALEESGNFDVVISGHTHQKRLERVGKTLALNPGSSHGFGERATIALLETSTQEAEVIPLS